MATGDMAQQHLRTVRTRAGKLRKAQDELADGILAAHDSGESYRDIAEFAGLPYSTVYKLATERQRELEEDPPNGS